MVPSQQLLKAKQTRTKVSELKDIAHSYEITVDENAKKNELQDAIKSFMDASVLELVSKTTASEMSLVDIGVAIRNAFHTPQFLSIDTV